MEATSTCHREPWNKGKLVGQKTPFRLKDIWAKFGAFDWKTMQSSTLQFTAGQLATTRALRKFCELHRHAEAWLQRLDAVLHAMEVRDAPGLAGALAPFTGGGMGSFIDWFPQPSSATEDDAYVEVLWSALYGNWREQMRPHWPARRG